MLAGSISERHRISEIGSLRYGERLPSGHHVNLHPQSLSQLNAEGARSSGLRPSDMSTRGLWAGRLTTSDGAEHSNNGRSVSASDPADVLSLNGG